MNKNSKQIVLSVAAILVGFALIFVLSNFIARARPALAETYADEDLTLQGARLKGYSLGFEGLIADWYWAQSLQYIGEKVLKTEGTINLENLKPLNPRLLYPLLDNATDLDPHFLAVYSYGAVVLPAIDPAQAIKITEKGIAENPQQWRLYQHLGYIYWRLGNFEKAAEVYEKGGKIEGAPAFFQLMAARMKSQGGSRETARAMYRQMFDETDNEQTKEVAEIRLRQLDSLDERDAIRTALRQFKAKNNRCANSWSEIFPLLKTVRLPGGKDFGIDKSNNLVDPSGAPYVLEKTNCDVSLDASATKIPLD
ncbi:MAG TPA: tetratricopeptide repeat protein [Pyrinomonadaceae bacterium]|jgi:tetratricopeptide (TPR) repeat protein